MNYYPEFAADLDPEQGWPRIRFNFANGWSASVVLRTSAELPCDAMQASLASCPTGSWGTGVTQLGSTEASADEVATWLADVAGRSLITLPPARRL